MCSPHFALLQGVRRGLVCTYQTWVYQVCLCPLGLEMDRWHWVHQTSVLGRPHLCCFPRYYRYAQSRTWHTCFLPIQHLLWLDGPLFLQFVHSEEGFWPLCLQGNRYEDTVRNQNSYEPDSSRLKILKDSNISSTPTMGVLNLHPNSSSHCSFGGCAEDCSISSIWRSRRTSCYNARDSFEERKSIHLFEIPFKALQILVTLTLESVVVGYARRSWTSLARLFSE